MVVGIDEKRSFTIVSVNDRRRGKGEENMGGRYISKTPAGAARKAGSQICRKTDIRGQCTLNLCIQETTRGSSNKIYHYKIKRVVNKKFVVHEGEEEDKKVFYKYKTFARANKDEKKKCTVAKRQKGGSNEVNEYVLNWKPYATEEEKETHTIPEFKIGDSVIADGFDDDNEEYYGTIIDIPEEGTMIYDNDLKEDYRPFPWEFSASCECHIDYENTGSVWFENDNERKYFVKLDNSDHIDLIFESYLRSNQV